VNAALTGGLVARSLSGEVERADLVVSDGRIGGHADGAPPVDVSGCLVVPGHVCSHHHLYSALARGMPGPARAPGSFVEILERVWWRLDRALDHDSIALSVTMGAVEAAHCGTTAIVDHHSSPEAIDSSLDVVADGVEAAGVRGVVCYEVSDRHGEARAHNGIGENLRFARSNRRELVRAMMGAHASFTLGARTLSALADGARDSGVPIHVHVAEDEFDTRHSVATYGVPAATRLASAGALGEGDVVAHGVWLHREEIALVRSSGAWVAHNPRSNMNNSVGYAPALEMGERVALGTDGIDGDMFAELRACYLRARERSLEVGPRDALDRLGAGASLVGALFGEPALGRLDPGAPADLVVLDARLPTPIDGSNLAGHYVFGLGSWAVRDVMVGGRWIVRHRRHQLVDEDELAARCREEAPRLWDRMQRF
jgi:putative selenium metabolism protein SsnA